MYQYTDANQVTHDLAYVCGTNGINVIDATNPDDLNPVYSFGGTQIVQGGYTVGRIDTIGGQPYLLVGTTATLNANKFTLLVYALANPTAPTLVSSTAFDYSVMADMLVQGNTILVPTQDYFFPASFYFGSSAGTALSIDVSDPARRP